MQGKKGGGKHGGGKAGTKRSVGRALIRRHQGFGPRGTGPLPKADHGEAAGGAGGQARPVLSSVLEMNSLDDFLETALMAQRDFAAVKERDLLIIDAKGGTPGAVLPPRGQGQGQKKQTTGLAFRQLKVPRRPAWHVGMTAAELDRLEKDAFLEWRREIAGLEEASGDKAKVTPFEKNLEVWRQLWRVLERSHVVVQIVDARDPLFYYSEDLHAYAGQMRPAPRARLILVNKADYLTPAQRAAWAAHFAGRGWEYAFFSARRAQEVLTEEARVARLREELAALEEEEGEDERPEEVTEPEADSDSEEEEEGSDEEGGDGEAGHEEEGDEEGAPRVLTREELLALLKGKAEVARAEALAGAAGEGAASGRDQQYAMIGMVGFPNVGKSSVINVLLGVTALDHQTARVAVSSTPGKTKHFQTLPLDASHMLCDCPGLVFPSFVATTADMVCAGVLPINQLRDHMAPVDLLCRRIPPRVLRGYYGLQSAPADHPEQQQPQQAREFLGDLCAARGFWAQGSGVPDVNRAARMVLKEYVEGRLVYCHPPPGLPAEEGEAYLRETKENLMGLSAKLRAVELKASASAETAAAAAAAAAVAAAAAAASEAGGDSGAEDVSADEGASRSGKPRVRPTKKWGKKGKKLRDKTPYADGDGDEEKPAAGARIMGRKVLAGGVGGFARVTMPHHASYKGAGGQR